MQLHPIRLLLVDDHKLFRKALTGLILDNGIAHHVEEAKDGLEAMDILGHSDFDVVLLDIQMPGMSGIDFLKKTRANRSAVKVIVLTQFEDEALIIYLLQLGANGLLLKDCEPNELKAAVAAVIHEGHYYGERVVDAIKRSLSKERILSNLNISPREFQVMVLLKEGKSSKEMANNLGLTLRTVESYRKGLIKKTNCRNTVDLINLAYRTGIMPK